MKKHLIIGIVLMLGCIGAIKAQQLNYQGIARNANGVAMTYQNISLRLSIKDGTTTSSATEYTETRQVRTNQFGLFTVVIGSAGATDVVGNMLTVNWVAGNKYLQVEIDPDGGSNFLFAGISQLQAVPYAIFATAAYPVGAAGGDLKGSNYPNPIVAPRAITNSKLSDTSVSTAKIIDGSVTNVKIASPFISINNLQVKLGNGQYFKTDTIGTEFNISSVDSTHQFNIPNASSTKRGLLKQTDWINFNNKLSSADTAFMLSNYFRKADTSVILSNRLKISDTAAMLSGYLRKNLALLISDTAAAFSVRPLTSRFLDTAAALHARIMSKLNITDAAATYTPLTRTLNGLSLATNQSFVTGAVGTDFSINSAAGIHTFNIPTASGTARGLLNSSDWSVFNNKQSAITLGSTAQYFKGDLSLGTFLTDVRSQFSAGSGVTITDGAIALANTVVTLNGLSLALGGSQTFVPGTSGTDFGISSLAGVHTFNLPTASAANRGLLQSSDWTVFNNKQSAITLGSTAQYFKGDLSLGTFQTDVRSQFSAGSGVTITDGAIALANTAVTLNGLSLALGGSQTFVPGTSGTDFGISSLAGVHTFNLPTATATNRGLLQYSDWTIFNNKQNTISLTGENYLSYNAGTSAFTAGQVDLSGSNVKGTLAAARFGALTGDVTNTAGSYVTKVVKIQGTDLSATPPTDKQILKYNLAATKWEPALDASANQWSITGNNGLTAGTNFLGTKDAVALQFKANNSWAGELNPNSTSTSYGMGAGQSFNSNFISNTAIGVAAMSLTSSGSDNTAVGQVALQLNVTGGNNTAVGQNALNASLGSNNTAVGKSALILNTVAGNTAVGAFSLQLSTTGTNNTGIGYNALQTNTSGSNNTALGYLADVSTGGLTNATAIGNGATVTASNTIQLGDGNVSLVNTSGAITAGRRITGTGARFKYLVISSNYAVTINDYYLKINASPITITLPDPTIMDGQRFVFYNATGGDFAMSNFTPAVLGYNNSTALHSTGTVVLFSDGANWLIESRNN